MKTLHIPFCKNLDFSPRTVADINIYRWQDNNYTPRAQAELCYNQKALAVRLSAYETNPRAVIREDGGAVYTDSCLEFFVRPEPDPRYLNFEMNPLGKTLLAFGDHPDPGRVSLIEKYRREIGVTPEKSAGHWGVTFQIPFSMLREIYGDIDFSRLRANFYKCGDHTASPHFGMWSEIKNDLPLFHLPQYFGTLLLDRYGMEFETQL